MSFSSVRNSMLALLALAMIAACLAPSEVQASSLWGDLEPGVHAIGFKTIEKFDYSRSFRPKEDYLGNALEGERARPIQICVWYPAEAGGTDIPMVYGEYAYCYPDDERFIDVLARLNDKEVGVLFAISGNNRGFVMDVQSIEMAAVKDAQIADGTFPVIVYHPNIETSFCDNLVLCEYLASHGYIVATTHPLGVSISDLTPSPDDATIEATTRDKEFVMANMRDFPNVDLDRIGAVGVGTGGLAAALMQMRNPDIAAVVDIGGALTHPDFMTYLDGNPFYDNRRLRAPLMVITPDDEFQRDMSAVESFKYADRYVFTFNGSGYLDFLAAGPILDHHPDSLQSTEGRGARMHGHLCRQVRQFVDAHLKDDPESMRQIESLVLAGDSAESLITGVMYEGQKPPPSSAEFVQLINELGGIEAVRIYTEFEKTDSGSITLNEGRMNMMGYQFLGAGRVDDAIALLKLNAEAYPLSANCWDSLADAYIAGGDNDTAVECYKKVLELLPGDPNAGDDLKEILRNNAETQLEALGGS